MKFKRVFTTVLASTLALSLVACGSENTENTETTPEAATEEATTETTEAPAEEAADVLPVSGETLTLGIMRSISTLPLIVARDQGYFVEEGVDVKLEFFNAAKDRDAALQANELDGVISDNVALALYQNGGIDMRITGITDGSFILVTAPESNILSFEDLKGKKVGISENTAIDYTLDVMLEANGLASNDVERAIIPPMPDRLEMLKTGQIDAAIMPNPFADDAMAAGATQLAVADGSDLPYISTINFLGSVIEEKGGDVQAFHRAVNKAVDYINANEVSAFEDVIITEIGYPESMRGDIVLPTFRQNVLPSEDEVNAVFDWSRERGLLSIELTAADVLSDVGVIK